MNPAINLEGLQGIEGLRNAAPGPVVPGPVAPMQSLEDAGMPLERTHDELPDYDDVQLHDYSPQSDNHQDAPMINDLDRQMIAHTRNLDNNERAARRANLAASNAQSAARSAARSDARYANFKGRVHPGGSKSKRKKRRTTRRKKTRKHTRK